MAFEEESEEIGGDTIKACDLIKVQNKQYWDLRKESEQIDFKTRKFISVKTNINQSYVNNFLEEVFGLASVSTWTNQEDKSVTNKDYEVHYVQGISLGLTSESSSYSRPIALSKNEGNTTKLMILENEFDFPILKRLRVKSKLKNLGFEKKKKNEKPLEAIVTYHKI